MKKKIEVGFIKPEESFNKVVDVDILARFYYVFSEVAIKDIKSCNQ